MRTRVCVASALLWVCLWAAPAASAASTKTTPSAPGPAPAASWSPGQPLPPSHNLGPGAATTTTGQTGTSPLAFSQCTNVGYALCFWKDAGYYNTFYYYNIWTYSQNNWHYGGAVFNDYASSLYNHRVHSSYIDKDWPPSSDYRCLSPEEADPNLTQWWWPDGSNENDSISSFDLLSTNPC